MARLAIQVTGLGAGVMIAVYLILIQPACAADHASTQLTAAERQQVKTLLADFRKAKAKPDDREKVVDQLIEIGGPAVLQLQAVLNKELFSQSKTYGQKFQKRAAVLSRGKAAAIDTVELQRQRAAVLALKEIDNLTKEMIVNTADPAMERLGELLVLDRKVVLEKSADLQAERDKLIALGKCWDKVMAALPNESLAATASGEGADDAAGKPATFEEYLRGEENLAAQLAMPMDDATRATLAANASLAARLDAEEARAILACNLTRNLLGLSTLKIDLQLSAAARDHSQDMEKLKFFAHESAVPGKKDPWARAKNFGTTASGENIYMGRTDGNQANLGWFHSPGHHKNMLGSHVRIGMGRSGGYFTELFGK